MVPVIDPIPILESAYRSADTVEAWLLQVLETIAPHLDEGLGSFAYVAHLPSAAFEKFVGLRGDMESWRSNVCAGAAREKNQRAVSKTYPFGLYIDTQVFAGCTRDVQEGEKDSWSLAFCDGEERLHIIAHPARRVLSMSDFLFPFWQKLAHHLGAAARLQRHPGTLDDAEVEAVFEPSGRVVHATPPAQSEREALRAAVKRIDRARTRSSDAEETLSLWTGLLLGRWSLVDQFDSDGRRFVVARKNDPSSPAPEVLTRRERQVAFYASLGASNDQIGYGLGLTPSTVATHLSSVLSKLGLSSRSQLIALAAQSGP